MNIEKMSIKKRQIFKRIGIHFLGIAPLFVLALRFLTDDMGANPIEELSHFTGSTTLVYLALSLSISPLHKTFPKLTLLQHRRTFGLYSFFYATLHVFNYIAIDRGFLWGEITEDILKRRYIYVGLFGYAILFVLAATSSRAAIRKLRKYWKPLHRLVYVAAVAGVVHFFWLVKADFKKPIVWAVIFTVLFLCRAVFIRNNQKSQKKD